MKSIVEVFKSWDTVVEMAADVGESHWTVRKWKKRGRIPHWAWTALIDALGRKGKHVTAADLLAMNNPTVTRKRTSTIAPNQL